MTFTDSCTHHLLPLLLSGWKVKEELIVEGDFLRITVTIRRGKQEEKGVSRRLGILEIEQARLDVINQTRLYMYCDLYLTVEREERLERESVR